MHRNIKRTFFIYAIILYFGGITKLYSQSLTTPKTFTVGANFFKGFILKHDVSVGHLIRQHPVGFEVYLNQNLKGTKPWQNRFKQPDIGYSLAYFDFKTKELGEMIAATAYIDFFAIRKKRSAVLLKIGTGIGYSTSPYNAESNNKNNMIGSRITFTMQGRIGYNFKVNEKLTLTSAITISHFSNGALKLPNKGINIFSSNFGVSYRLSNNPDPSEITIEPELPHLENRKNIHYHLSIFSGVREIEPEGGNKHPFINLVLYGEKKLNDKSGLMLGADFFYSLAIKEEIETARELPPGEKPDFKRIGITLGHELLISKISLLTQIGVYAYRPYKDSGQPIYQRYGLKYYVNHNIFAGLFLKAHYGNAESVEWGVGIRL